ncbi:uncharacterized protein LOC132386523, partial [Hypanus sabinus]|uniref:uncharacterized protein LOC132386523 n=1 Tax=Hypanus sabinus TaxID=79690 RepID=UPI0028C3B897
LTQLSKPASADNGYFSFLSSDTQRILDRIDDREASMNKKRTNTGSRAPSRDDLTSTYTELNIRKVERLSNRQADGLDPTYSQLNLRQNEVLIAKEEDPPLASGRGSQAAAHEQQSKVKIGNRPFRLICLLCLVTSALIVTVAGLSIHVSQIRQSLKRMQSDLSHQFTEMETKYRSVNETKAEICEILTSRREQNSSKDWVTNKDRCYYVSRFEASFQKAIQECSIRDSRNASSDNGCFPCLSSETQRILGRMDRSERHMNVKFGKKDSRSPSRAEPDVSYAQVNFKTLSASRVRTDQDGLNSTYSELNFRKEEPRIDEDQDPPISSGRGGLPITAQAGCQGVGEPPERFNRTLPGFGGVCYNERSDTWVASSGAEEAQGRSD